MSWRYDPATDRFVGHDSLTGNYGHGMHDYMMDEIELGARAAILIDDPHQWWWEGHQWWWEVHRLEIEAELSRQDEYWEEPWT